MILGRALAAVVALRPVIGRTRTRVPVLALLSRPTTLLPLLLFPTLLLLLPYLFLYL